ncbi:hypothetical protein BC829DRAFT_122029 [Chytridium lagenaria]|nr:hypothetical protein BC829DRAFT_122029 [Chytridium lagenaria]
MSDTDEDLPLRFLNARLPSEEVVDDEGDEIPLLRNRKESKRLLTTAVAGALTPKRDREVKRKKMNRRTSSVPEGGGTGNRNSVAGDKFENAANEVFEVNVTIKEARSRREDPRRAGGGAVDRKDAALDDVEGAVHEANEISMRMRGRRSDPTLVSGEVTGSNTVAVGVEYLEISQKFTRSETSLTKTSPMRAIEAISTMKAAFEDSSASTRSVSPVGAGSAITRSEPLSIRISPSPDIQTATRSPVFKSVTSTAKGRSPARIGRNQASNQNEADDDVMIISSLPSSPSQNESISRPYHSAARMMMFDVDANEVVPVQPLRRRMTRKDSLNLHSIQTSPISLEREDSVDALPTQSVCASPRRTATVEPAAVQPPNEAAGEASVGYVDGPEDPASPVGGEAQRGGIARYDL